MARDEALVTASVIEWARTKAGYDILTAASRIGRPPSEIKQWEEGTLRPTLAQARKAAEVYKRPLAVFYLPEPPRGFDTLRDYRHLPGHLRREPSPELALLIRQVQVRQEWLREYLVSEGVAELGFVRSVSTSTPPARIGKAIREKLGISTDDQRSCKDRREALNLWIYGAEAAGVCVCRQGRIDCQEARGFALADPYAPFIYVNSADALAGQLFTLVHELVHIWLGESGISNLEGIPAGAPSGPPALETFCNGVASVTLVDPEGFRTVWASTDHALALRERINSASSSLKVSEEFVARRLLDRGEIGAAQYARLRRHYEARWQELAERPRRKGGGNYYNAKVANNSRAFTQTVIGACRSGEITIRDASSLLGVKANHLSTLAAHAGYPMRRRGQ